MSYSLDANILIHASNRASERHVKAAAFLEARVDDPDVLCLTWPVAMAYQRIVTHPSIFEEPLTPAEAWANITSLLNLPRTRVITEDASFAELFKDLNQAQTIRGNLVPDAHLAALLQEHGVKRLYTADADFRRFPYLEVINPFEPL
ncbi:MAG: TA system VapC family ribonuclease toxin [Opitutales bacterium]